MELWNHRSEQQISSAQTVTRAQRFLISAPVAYRFPPEACWTNGRVANISRSGLLLETTAFLRNGLELEVQVPIVNSSLGIESQMRCRCIVVRTVEGNGQFAAGARITSYALGHAPTDQIAEAAGAP